MIINDIGIQADLVDILIELRSQLKQHGINLLSQIKESPGDCQVCCPYHKGGQEKRPSAGIRKTDGTFHCFACGETHSLQEVISHCFGKDNDIIGVFGWEWILKNFLTVGIESRKKIELDLSRKAPTNSTQYISESELDTYRVYHPYMWKRKMTPEVVDIFDIGYDAETQSITFPVREESGKCLFVARRSVNTKFFNYPAGAEKPVYGLYELRQLEKYPDEVIICESMIDCLYFWTIGKYAVDLNGLGNELQLKQRNKMPCRKFILCTDSDDAGMKARKRLRANLKNKLITEYILPKDRKDANECTIEELKSLQEVF